MPSVLKSQPTAAVGQSKTVVFSAGANVTATIIGCLCSNVGAVAQNCSAYMRRASVDYSIITNGSVPVGNTLAVVGEEGKVVLMPNDALVVVNSAGTTDVIVSYLEQTP
jgi:hypothetical protein